MGRQQGSGLQPDAAAASRSAGRVVALGARVRWFATTPQVVVTPAPSTTVDVSIDGGPAVPYAGPFVPSGLGNGMHVVTVTGSDGGSTSRSLQLDTQPPTLAISLSPPANPAGWRNQPVTATFSCDDSGSGVADCPDDVSSGAQEGAAIALSGTAVDRVGRTSTVTATVKVDLTPPSLPAITLEPPSRDASTTSSITVASTDGLSTVAGGEWWTGADPGVGQATALTVGPSGLTGDTGIDLPVGLHTVFARVHDLAGNWSAIGEAELEVVTDDNPDNLAPVATPLTITTDEDVSAPITLAATDGDGDTLTFSVLDDPEHGTLSGSGASRTYAPDPDFHGTDSFSYRASDGIDQSQPATVSITVTSINDPPTVSAPEVRAAVEGSPVTVTAVADDIDGDALTINWTVVPTASIDPGGDCTIVGAGTLQPTFTCSDDGAFSATVVVDDTYGPTASATVTLDVANADPEVDIESQPVGAVLVGADVEIVASILEPGTNDSLSCDIDWGDGSSTTGAIDATGPTTCSGTHAYSGPGSNDVAVSVSDDDDGTGTATTSVNVVDGNRPPTATGATVDTPEDTPLAVPLHGGDADGDPLVFTIVTAPGHGTLTRSRSRTAPTRRHRTTTVPTPSPSQ